MNDISMKELNNRLFINYRKTKTYVNILQLTIKICIMTKKDKQLKVLYEV